MIISKFAPYPHLTIERHGADRHLCFRVIQPRSRTNGIVFHWDYLGFVWGDRRWQVYWRKSYRPRGNIVEHQPTGNRNFRTCERARRCTQ